MKKATKIISVRLTVLFLALFSTITALAQDAGSIYDYRTTGRPQGFNEFTGPFPYVVFGVVITLLGYMGYRYWKDEMSDDHMPHHQ